MKTNDIFEYDEDVIDSIAIDYIDDQLSQLSNDEQYGEQGDVLRYILSKPQQ